MSSRRQNYVSQTFSKLTEGALVKEINDEKQKIPNVILQELQPSFKDSMTSLQQQSGRFQMLILIIVVQRMVLEMGFLQGNCMLD